MAFLSKKWAKRIGIGAVISYVALVIIFETLLGIVQPQAGETIVLISFDDENEPIDRVVSTP
jgi:hypothetical protein